MMGGTGSKMNGTCKTGINDAKCRTTINNCVAKAIVHFIYYVSKSQKISALECNNIYY
jgi:hypothetical protein